MQAVNGMMGQSCSETFHRNCGPCVKSFNSLCLFQEADELPYKSTDVMTKCIKCLVMVGMVTICPLLGSPSQLNLTSIKLSFCQPFKSETVWLK